MTSAFTSAVETTIRFTVKTGLAALLSALGERSFVLSFAGWLSVFAFSTVIFALLEQEPFRVGKMTRWDDALWLAGMSMIALAYYRLEGL